MPNSGGLAGVIPALWIGGGLRHDHGRFLQCCDGAFRALVADNLPDSQRTHGFSIQTFLIGLGAVVGSDLPDWLARLGFSKVAGPNGVADNIKYSYLYRLGHFHRSLSSVTVFRSKEYPPEEYERYNGRPDAKGAKKPGLARSHRFPQMPKTMRQLGLVQFFSWFAMFSMWVFTTER